MGSRVDASPPFGLSDAAHAALIDRVERALALARRTGRLAVASVSVPAPADVDPSATVLAARRPDDRFFCFEQPDRDGYAVCGLGAVASVRSRGAGRFDSAVAGCRELTGRIVAGDLARDPTRPPGSGPVF